MGSAWCAGAPWSEWPVPMQLILVLALRSLAGAENLGAAAASPGSGAGQLVLSEGLSVLGAALL